MHIDCGDIGDSRFVPLENRQTIFRVLAVVVDFLEHVFALDSKGKDA
jgi:hypothetical protein